MISTLLCGIAENELGVAETAGHENNPRILYYAKKAGLTWVKDDETSWCGIFMGFCFAELPEFIRPKNWPKQESARARSWLGYGAVVKNLDDAKPGDILIFWRGEIESWKGHVCFYVKHQGDKVYCLGGNQGDMVKIEAYPASKLLGIRRF